MTKATQTYLAAAMKASPKALAKTSTKAYFNILCLTGLMAGAIPAIAELDVPGAARLAEFRNSPAVAGALIYRGSVSPLNRSTADPLYTYERRVEKNAQGSLAAHLTSDLQGDVVIVEAAQASPTYDLQRFDNINKQLGYSGSVVVSANGQRLEYQLNDNGKISTASEDITAPAVVGPQMFGLILNHWSSLKAGKTLPVRMIVLKAKTTYGFDIRHESEVNGQASFTVTPSNFLIRLAIAPMRVVFDVASSTMVRYEGRVPPMESVAGKLKDLDARVNYQNIETSFR